MKKIVLFFAALYALALVGCASTNSISKKMNADGFVEEHDDLTGNVFVTHPDLQTGSFYNLKDSLTGERENIAFFIINKSFGMHADYQYSRWIFIDSVVLLNDSEDKLIISDGKQSSNVVSGSVVREGYSSILNDGQILMLEKIVKSPVAYCAFTGSKGRTDKLVIKEKQKSAIISTINEWRKINGGK